GTGRDRCFGPTQADVGRWAAVLSWDDEHSAASFEDSAVARDWRSIATGYCRVDLVPLTSRGTWAGQTPFDTDDARTGDARIGDARIGDANTGDARTGDAKTGG